MARVLGDMPLQGWGPGGHGGHATPWMGSQEHVIPWLMSWCHEKNVTQWRGLRESEEELAPVGVQPHTGHQDPGVCRTQGHVTPGMGK